MRLLTAALLIVIVMLARAYGLSARIFSSRGLHRQIGGRRRGVPLGAFDLDGGDEALPEPTQRKSKFVDVPFSYHQELELDIDDVTNTGVGVGRVELKGNAVSDQRWVVMVPLVLPGERVRARVFRNHGTYSEADLVEVLSKSPDRVQPQCSFFETCGGCQYQMMSVDAQRRWKRSQVVSLMQRLGGVDVGSTPELSVNEVIGTEHTYGYRSKITPHYNSPRTPAELKVGFQQRGTRIVIDVDRCVIATDPINTEYTKARAAIRAQVQQKLPKKGATLLFREGDQGHVETDFRKNMVQQVKGVRFTFKAGEFFQNNAHVLPLMVDHVLSLLRAPLDGGSSSSSGTRKVITHLIDAYCGSGLFSLCAAKDKDCAFKEVYGVEVSELAVKAAEANARENNISNAKFLCGSSEAIFAKVGHLPRASTAMILDPPRKGCDRQFLEQLFSFSPARVVYVSCDPATQARDTKIMIEDGGYCIKSITPVDLFPQTRHIENVVCFEKACS